MLYQYFDSQERKLDEEIASLEHLTSKFMNPDDIIRLIRLKAQRDSLKTVFNDLYNLVVDFDTDFK